MLTPENYVTGFSVVMAMYSLQMLFMAIRMLGHVCLMNLESVKNCDECSESHRR